MDWAGCAHYSMVLVWCNRTRIEPHWQQSPEGRRWSATDCTDSQELMSKDDTRSGDGIASNAFDATRSTNTAKRIRLESMWATSFESTHWILARWCSTIGWHPVCETKSSSNLYLKQHSTYHQRLMITKLVQPRTVGHGWLYRKNTLVRFIGSKYWRENGKGISRLSKLNLIEWTKTKHLQCFQARGGCGKRVSTLTFNQFDALKKCRLEKKSGKCSHYFPSPLNTNNMHR